MGCYYYVCLLGFLRASFNDVALQFHASSFYYIQYAENNRQFPVVFANDGVIVLDSVVSKNSYLCGDGDKSVDTYQKKRYALLLAET